MNFVDRVDRLIETHPKTRTRKELADSLGFAIANFSAWRKRGNFPSGDLLVKIASHLGTSAEYLVTGQDPREDPWIAEHRELIQTLKEIDEQGMRALETVAESLAFSSGKYDTLVDPDDPKK